MKSLPTFRQCLHRLRLLVAAAILPAAVTAEAQTPLQPGLHAWFKADAGVTVSAGNVTSWTDQTANGFVLTPTGAGPVFTTSSLNGLPALTFDGTRQLNGNLGGTGPGDASVFALFRYTIADSDNDYLYTLGANGSSGSQLTLSRRSTQRAYHYDGSTQNLSGNGAMPAAQWFVSSQIYGGTSAASHELYLNGAAILRTTAGNSYAPAASPFIIGNWSSTADNRFFGDLVELLVYDRPLTEAGRRSVEEYLRMRAGLPPFFEAEAEVISGWEVIQYELNGQPDAQWIFDLGGTRADQSVNSDASILLRPGDASGKVIWGRMGSGTAPDFMGFVFGYQDRGHYYLFDWKKITDSYLSFGTAPAGMRLRKFHVPSGDPGGREFWAGDIAANVTPLFSNELVWGSGVDYDFSLRYLPGAIVIRVWQGTTVLQEWRVNDTTYPTGRFGYFVNSLQNVRFGQVFVHDAQPVDFRATVWAAAPEDGGHVLWTGGEPPYLLERSTSLAPGSWAPLSGHLWKRDAVIPTGPDRAFLRVRSIGSELTGP